jgi:hypothetical protein
MMSGMGGMIAQGMAFGAGSAIAHRAVGAVAEGMSGDSDEGGATEQQQQQQSQERGPCGEPKGLLYQCLETQNGSAGACQYYFDALRSCQENQSQSAGGSF